MTVLNPAKLVYELMAQGLPPCVVNRDNTVANAYIDTSQCAPNQVASVQTVLNNHNGAIDLGKADLTTTGTKLITTIIPAGRIGLARGFWFGISSAPQAVTTPATVSLGVVGPNYVDLTAATALTGFGQGDVIYVPITTKKQAITTTVPVFLNVTIAAVSTGVVVGAIKFDIDYL